MADLANKWAQGFTHLSLVCGRRVLTPHGHYHPFVQTEGCRHCRQMDAICMYSRLEEGVRHVNFSPYLAFRAIRQNVIDAGEWVIVWDRIRVEFSIVVYPSW